MPAERNGLHCFVEPSVAMRGAEGGPLNAVDFVVKDLVDLAGHVSSFGHGVWRDTHVAAVTTTPIVARLLDAGANLVGATKLDQLAYSLTGDLGEGAPPRNIGLAGSFCGGSSSGTASAVAGGVAEFGIGTDTAGSTRVPAALCGLFGLRPTHGVLDATGVIPLAPSFDTLGLLARDIETLSTVYGVLEADTCAPWRGRSPRASGVLVAAGPFGSSVESARPIVAAAAARLADRWGVPAQRLDVSEAADEAAGELLVRMMSREVWARHGDWVEEHGEALTPEVRDRLLRARRFTADPPDVVGHDAKRRTSLGARICEWLAGGHVLVMPVASPEGLALTATATQRQRFRIDALRLNALAGLSGAPEVVVPFEHAGRRAGVGLIASRGSDQLLLAAASALSRAQ